MYPVSRDAALVEQLETERAISELTELALEIWLPLAQRAVLHAAAPPPDPAAVAEQDAQWSYLVDAIILYGIGIIAADAMHRAYSAIAGVPLAISDVVNAIALPDFPGLPSRSTLRSEVSSILRHRLSIDIDNVEGVLAETSILRAFVNDHVNSIRDRVLDAVGRAFAKVSKVNEELPAQEAREEIPEVLNSNNPEWQNIGDMVGQTQATNVLNAATTTAALAAGQELGTEFTAEWVSVLDRHTRAAHVEADGQRVPLGQAFTVGGEQLRWPGDITGSIENTANCRCRAFAFKSSTLTAAITHGPDTMANGHKEKTMGQYRAFTSVLAVIGEETDDGRMFADDIGLAFRDFPLPLMWQKQSAGGHFDAFTVGVIEAAGVVGKQVIGHGYLLDTPEAAEAAGQIGHGVTGPSVDLGDVEWELRDKLGNKITEEDLWEDPEMKVVQTVLSAKVLAATLVSTPAFGSTSISLGEMVDRGQEALVAAAAMAPVYAPVEKKTYPSEFFNNPEFSAPTLPHITEGGRIQGHLAAFNVCHVGIQDSCVIAPRSATDYAWFHTSPPVKTDSGKVKVGRLTVGGGHASHKLGVGSTIEHYDNAGTCFALVHAGEDEHGIWFSGVPAPGATPEQIEAGLSAPLSGDWRNVGGNLELVAALAVNTPGFPIIASGATDVNDEPLSLVASLGPCKSDPGTNGYSADQVVSLAQEIVKAMRAADKREAETKTLLAGLRRQESLALLDRMK